MSQWWWASLAVGSAGAGALALLARRLRAEGDALRDASRRLRRAASDPDPGGQTAGRDAQ